MKARKTKWHEIDRTPAHMRYVEESIHCECGAMVKERFGELHHVGPCPIQDNPQNEESKDNE